MHGQMFRCPGCFRLLAIQDGCIVQTLESVSQKVEGGMYLGAPPIALTIDASAFFGRAVLCLRCLPTGVESWPCVDVGIRP